MRPTKATYDIAYKAAMKPWATEVEKEAFIRLAANASVDLDPPSYLPMREPLPPRIPDLNPDDEFAAYIEIRKGVRVPPEDAAAMAFDEIMLGAAFAKKQADGTYKRVDPTTVRVSLPFESEPHNPETCRDPACECMPF